MVHVIIISEDDAGDYRMRQFQPSMSTEAERHVLHSTGKLQLSSMHYSHCDGPTRTISLFLCK